MNQWKNISWFGNFYDNNSSWIYHDSLGWVYRADFDESSWLYHTSLGWLWTDSSVYPYLYSTVQASWLFVQNTNDNAMYFNKSSSQWTKFSNSVVQGKENIHNLGIQALLMRLEI